MSDHRNQYEKRPANGQEFLVAFITFQVLFLGHLFRSISPFVLAGMFLLYAIARRRTIVRDLLPVLPILVLPLWAALSTVWSEAPVQTVRYALRLIGTALVALILIRTMPARKVAAAVALAGLVSMVVELATGQQDLERGLAMAGGMGSKNYLASHASIAALFGLGVALDAEQSRRMRLVGLFCLGASIAALAFSDSAGAWLATIVGTMLFFGVWILARAPGVVRGAIIVCALVSVPIAWFAVADPVKTYTAMGLAVTDKDPTFTRRTTLWIRAVPIIRQRPILGHGYRSFWRQGVSDSEGLWREMNVPARQGFNFHNQFVELLVELGIVGLVLFALTAIFGMGALLARGASTGSASISLFAGVLGSMLLRTPVETMLVLDLTVFSTLFFACCGLGASRDLRH
ncbi:MAG: O-antigen ligase family protein [Hyphomonadaceae bacterium]|nr:O-antigen ligase family protein [Hyphomonadaceae bacterium]